MLAPPEAEAVSLPPRCRCPNCGEFESDFPGSSVGVKAGVKEEEAASSSFLPSDATGGAIGGTDLDASPPDDTDAAEASAADVDINEAFFDPDDLSDLDENLDDLDEELETLDIDS